VIGWSGEVKSQQQQQERTPVRLRSGQAPVTKETTEVTGKQGTGGIGWSGDRVKWTANCRQLFANANAIVFDDPKLAFWRSFRQCGHKALQESNQRWFVLGLGTEKDDAGKRLRWVGLVFPKSKSRVSKMRLSFRHRAMTTPSSVPERFSSPTVSAWKPARSRIERYSIGRFSSILNFKLWFPEAGSRCPHEWAPQHRIERPQCRLRSAPDSFAVCPGERLRLRGCPRSQIPSRVFRECMLCRGISRDSRWCARANFPWGHPSRESEPWKQPPQRRKLPASSFQPRQWQRQHREKSGDRVIGWSEQQTATADPSPSAVGVGMTVL